MKTLRDNILVQESAVGVKDLEFLMACVHRAQMDDSPVSSFEEEATEDAVEWVINKDIRNTQHLHLTKAVADKLKTLHRASVRALVNPFYNLEVRDSEPAQILHYGVGGHYVPHVDAETLYKDDEGLELWEKTLDRDLSVVYFLNDAFKGGELVFPALNLTVKPKAGTLVCFPSDHNYVHGVNPVTAGHRYTIVTWMRVKGIPTMDEINQEAMNKYHRHRPKQMQQPPRVKKRSA